MNDMMLFAAALVTSGLLALAAHAQPAGEAEGMEAEIQAGTRMTAATTTGQTIPMTARVSDEPQQTIKGWGYYPGSFRPDWSPSELFTMFDKPEVLEALYKDLRPDQIRVNILPKMYDPQTKDLDREYINRTLVPHLRAAKEYGITNWFITTWSPPPSMKQPQITNGRDDQGNPTRLLEEFEDEFVTYYVDALEYLREQGLGEPMMLTIQNELSFPARWDGCVYSDEQYQRVAKMMRKELDSRGFEDTVIAGPESGSYSGQLQYLGGPGWPHLNSDPELNEAIGAIAFHGYGGRWSQGEWPTNLREAVLNAKALDKDIWMTEWSIIGDKGDRLAHAIDVMRRLGRETAYIPVNYWNWWQGWRREFNGEQLLAKMPGKPIDYTKLYYTLQTLWQNAPAGSVVHRVDTSDSEIKGFDPEATDLVAFRAPDRMTVMLVNHTGTGRDLTLAGLPAGEATLHLTTSETDMQPHALEPVSSDGSAQFQLPARSIGILVVKTN